MGTVLRLLTIFAGLLTASISLATSPTNWSPLVEPTALSAMLDEHIRIIHVTGDYAEGHIPGAVHAPYASFRGPQENPGQLPPLSNLTHIVQTAGITADTPIIVVHHGSNPADMGAATRVYWTLKSLGVNNVAVLNGGFTGWRDAGLPTSTAAPTVEASTFEPQWSDTWQIRADEIHQALGTDALQLVDSRPAAFYLGQQSTAARAGTIPGASNMTFAQFFDGPRMLSQPQLSSLIADASLNEGPTVTFCNTGQLGSIGWFVLSEMTGMSDVRLYAESITEWADKGLSMENESE